MERGTDCWEHPDSIRASVGDGGSMEALDREGLRMSQPGLSYVLLIVLQAFQAVSEKEALLAVLQAALAHLDYVPLLVVPLSQPLPIDRSIESVLVLASDYLCLPQLEPFNMSLVSGKHRYSFDIRKPSKNVSSCWGILYLLSSELSTAFEKWLTKQAQTAGQTVTGSKFVD